MLYLRRSRMFYFQNVWLGHKRHPITKPGSMKDEASHAQLPGLENVAKMTDLKNIHRCDEFSPQIAGIPSVCSLCNAYFKSGKRHKWVLRGRSMFSPWEGELFYFYTIILSCRRRLSEHLAKLSWGCMFCRVSPPPAVLQHFSCKVGGRSASHVPGRHTCHFLLSVAPLHLTNSDPHPVTPLLAGGVA